LRWVAAKGVDGLAGFYVTLINAEIYGSREVWIVEIITDIRGASGYGFALITAPVYIRRSGAVDGGEASANAGARITRFT
jgi:hypothetical protein